MGVCGGLPLLSEWGAVVKTAIYIEDGTIQLVITPETEFEKDAMRTFNDKAINAEMFVGQFYDCRGGWVRQQDYYGGPLYGTDDRRDRSLILRIATHAPEQEVQQCVSHS